MRRAETTDPHDEVGKTVTQPMTQETEHARDRWHRRTFASLRNRNFRAFFIGQAVSLSGTWMQSVALAWLVLQLTGSATWIGLAIALQTLPVLLLAPYAGVVIDRVNKRRLLIALQVVAGVQALALGLLTITGSITMAWVIALSITLGAVNAVDNPCRQAFVREMVLAEHVQNAVSLNAVLINIARAVGPAIGGILIATVGVGTCFLVNGASFIAVIIAYLSMHVHELHSTAPVARAPGQLRAGLAYVRRTRELLIPLVMMAIVGTLTYEFQVVLPAFATDTFGTDAKGFGWITAAMGVGAIIGGLFTAGQSRVGIRTLAMASTAFGLSVGITAVCPNELLAELGLVLVGASSIWFLSTGNATLQLAAAPEMRGRVMSLWTVAFIGTTPIGGPIVGWISEQASPR
ncbi:MAG: MFS transporter, partial [Candidatus Nanopelagicales bacterium]|nr:MFS transporter [Candidatus Nanopelagicales bacterium]